MLMTVIIAVVGGTIISIIIGYLVAYGKDLFNGSGSLSESAWSKAFNRFVHTQANELKGTTDARAGFDTGASRAASQNTSDISKSAFSKLAETYETLSMKEESRFFENLAEDKNKLEEICQERAKQFKQKWGYQLSSQFLKERFTELVQERAFSQNKQHALNSKQIFELWESFAALAMFFEDTKWGSLTLSERLSQKLQLSPANVLRGVEYWFLSRAGQSKDSLFKTYWQQEGKGAFEKSEKLKQFKSERRVQLLLSLTFPARFKVKIFSEVLKELENGVLELEAHLESLHSESNQKQQSNKQSSSSQNSQKIHKTKITETDFDLLEIKPTTNMREIKKAFHKMALKLHPDHVKCESLEEEKAAHESYLKVQKAFERLEAKYGKLVA